VFLVHFRNCLDDAQSGTHGALGVVLVRDRRAEDSHYCVANELLDGAAEALDLAFEQGVIGP